MRYHKLVDDQDGAAWAERGWAVVAGALLLLLAAGLFFDASSFGLVAADPLTGRERGCFPAVEMWLGLKRPSIIRAVEAFTSFGCLVAAVLLWTPGRGR